MRLLVIIMLSTAGILGMEHPIESLSGTGWELIHVKNVDADVTMIPDSSCHIVVIFNKDYYMGSAGRTRYSGRYIIGKPDSLSMELPVDNRNLGRIDCTGYFGRSLFSHYSEVVTFDRGRDYLFLRTSRKIELFFMRSDRQRQY